jgi:hypothetical protein
MTRMTLPEGLLRIMPQFTGFNAIRCESPAEINKIKIKTGIPYFG